MLKCPRVTVFRLLLHPGTNGDIHLLLVRDAPRGETPAALPRDPRAVHTEDRLQTVHARCGLSEQRGKKSLIDFAVNNIINVLSY